MIPLKVVHALPCLLLLLARISAAEYHISATGNDSSDGLAPATAWRSIDRVNQVTFQPGDRLLFESDGRWTGQLRPKGCGAQNQPIRIGRYGTGALPVISQGDAGGVVIGFENQDFWEVTELVIDGGTPKPDQKVGGVHFRATNAGRILRHVVVRDCEIRNIRGTVKDYESCAIWVGVPGWNRPEGATTTFEWVLVENNRITDSSRCAILVWTPSSPAGQHPEHRMFSDGLLPSKHVVIRGNQVNGVGGDAILVLGSEKPLIERNIVRRSCLAAGDAAIPVVAGYNPSAAAIWLHSCLGGIMQFNQVHDSAKQPNNNDGMAFDFDFNCKDCLLQYNFSRNNAGGFLLIMISARDNIARYNLSLNDRDHLLYLVGRLDENNLVHNNTFHVWEGKENHIIPRAKIVNNIFHVTGGATIEERDTGGGLFQNNCYSGNWKRLPEDTNRLAADPGFLGTDASPDVAASFRNYSLRPDSPCLQRGTPITANGGRDLTGKPVPENQSPDLGALQRSK